MDNILRSYYQEHRLSHAVLLEYQPESAARLYREFITTLKLNPADYLFLEPDTTIKIAEARLIRQFAYKSRFNSPIKAVFITNANLLTKEAANALLKTLEEPPPATHLFLATAYLDELLPTIRSRCQLISQSLEYDSVDASVPPLTDRSLTDWFTLSKKLAADEAPLTYYFEAWLRREAHEPLTSRRAERIKSIINALQLSAHNPNRRLLLDNFFLDLYNTNQ